MNSKDKYEAIRDIIKGGPERKDFSFNFSVKLFQPIEYITLSIDVSNLTQEDIDEINKELEEES